jgi:hypothetical protein
MEQLPHTNTVRGCCPLERDINVKTMEAVMADNRHDEGDDVAEDLDYGEYLVVSDDHFRSLVFITGERPPHDAYGDFVVLKQEVFFRLKALASKIVRQTHLN